MFILQNKEMLATIGGLPQCYFYPERVDSRRELPSLVRLFCGEMFTGLPVGDVCVFFLKGKDFVRILKSEPWGWELEHLSVAESKAFLELEWLTNITSTYEQ